MKHPFRLNASEKNQPKGATLPLVVPQFRNEVERLDWIKQQAVQVADRELEVFRQRLALVKHQTEQKSPSLRLDQEG